MIGPWYVSRVRLKAALGIPSSSTSDHDQLDDAIESVSRMIDQHLGYGCHPVRATRHLTARDSDCVRLPVPLTNVVTLRTDAGGDSTYETTWSTGDYRLTPDDASAETPPRPYWFLERSQNGSNVFPSGIPRGVEAVADWGYFNQTRLSTAVVASSALNATETALSLTGASSLYPGDTIRIDSEQMFVRLSPASSTGSHASQVTVTRAVNGTTGATHTSGAAISVYEYPVVGRAALYQSELDYRAKDSPFGTAAGPFAGQSMTPSAVAGGLHPLTVRMLDTMRVPVAF